MRALFNIVVRTGVLVRANLSMLCGYELRMRLAIELGAHELSFQSVSLSDSD